MDSSTNCGSRLHLYSSRAHDDVVTYVAAGGGDQGGHVKLVAFDTRNPAGQRLIDSRSLNVVLVLMVTSSVLGPVFTEHFAPRLLKDANPPDRMKAAGTL